MFTTLFMNNQSQAVRIPSVFKFHADTKKVFVRVIGVDRIISPVDHVWDSFFDDPDLKVTSDFSRGDQIESVREEF